MLIAPQRTRLSPTQFLATLALLIGSMSCAGAACPANLATSPATPKIDVLEVADLCVTVTQLGDATFLYPLDRLTSSPQDYSRFLNSLSDVTANYSGHGQILKGGAKGEELSVKDSAGTSIDQFVSSMNQSLSAKNFSFILSPALASRHIDYEIEIGSAVGAHGGALHAIAHLANGGTHDFTTGSWMYGPEEQSLVVISIEEAPLGKLPCGIDPLVSTAASPPVPPAPRPCAYSFVLVRTPPDQPGKVLIGFKEEMKGKDHVLVATEALRQNINQNATYAINNVRIRGPHRADQVQKQVQPFVAPPTLDGWTVTYHQLGNGCRAYPLGGETATINIPHVEEPIGPSRANGIAVGAAKIYDVLALQRMLADTANQLLTVSGFNGAAITAALSNVQGITRDVSSFSAQIATLPSASTTANTGNTLQNANTGTITTPGPATVNSTVTLQCPDGSVPSIGSGNTQGCTVLPSASGVTGSGITTNTQTQTNAAVTNQQVTGTTNTQQSGTTVTNPSISGSSFIPAALASTALTPPSNVGLSSADLLTDQVQLNAQITTLRLLLQGALSDQYLVKDARPVATRQQTTLGFSVSLEPPRQYKHAVAEVRVIISPPPGGEGVSIMNLLPSEKTYNVAKVTSSEKAFGAGVVKAPIGIGINAGSSHDRLFLAKDTDTLALQFASLGAARINPRLPVAIVDRVHTVLSFEGRGECDTDITKEMSESEDAVAFGWQFRPVLGEAYVKGGMRQVFAQLALPAGLDMQYAPRVRILTRWRAYNPTTQVVGEVYSRTCSWTDDSNGVVLLSRPAVRKVDWTDLGGGQLKLTGEGSFYSSGVTVVAGTTVYSPVAFDGSKIQFVGKATDLMASDELSLVGQNGQNSPFATAVAPDPDTGDVVQGCEIPHATLSALPTPDGNSRMQLTVDVGGRYSLDELPFPTSTNVNDGPIRPLVMIGAQVYGLRETPFTDPPECKRASPANAILTGPMQCTYRFVAPSTDARNAQLFSVRDLAWSNMKTKGYIQFLPSFSALTQSPWATPKKNGKPDEDAPVKYGVSGFNLRGLAPCQNHVDPAAITAGHAPSRLCVSLPSYAKLEILSDNAGLLALDAAYAATKVVRLQLRDADSPGNWDGRVVWDLAVPKADAAESAIAAVQVHRGDSTQVTFKGTDLDKVDAVDFETIKGLTFKYDANAKSLAVMLTTAITKTSGHKVLTASGAKLLPAGKVILLPVDVLK